MMLTLVVSLLKKDSSDNYSEGYHGNEHQILAQAADPWLIQKPNR